MSRTYSITDLSREFELTTRAIRFYEDQGLLAPERKGQQRIYTPRDRVRLKLILRGKRLGFSLGEIREMLDLYDAEPNETAQLRHVVEKARQRRIELERQQHDLALTLAELKTLEDQCLDLLARKAVAGE